MKELTLYEMFAKNLKDRRESQGLTQRQLAAKIGIAQPGYALIECGKREPGLDVLSRIAHALGCRPAELLEENLVHSG